MLGIIVLLAKVTSTVNYRTDLRADTLSVSFGVRFNYATYGNIFAFAVAPNNREIVVISRKKRSDRWGKPEEEWEDFNFQLISSDNGKYMRHLQTITMDGKLAHTGSYTTAYNLSSTEILFAITVEEGTYDEEKGYLHGYKVDLNDRSHPVRLVFRIGYDYANFSPYATVLNNKLYVVYGDYEGNPLLDVFDIDALKAKGAAADHKKLPWPHRRFFQYGDLASADDHLFGILINGNDDFDRMVAYSICGKTVKKEKICKDEAKGYPHATKGSSSVVFSQLVGTHAVFAVDKKGLWKLELGAKAAASGYTWTFKKRIAFAGVHGRWSGNGSMSLAPDGTAWFGYYNSLGEYWFTRYRI